MPIFAYVGRPRSGKSYEVTSVVILGALRDGRRVVSNIAGLNYQAMVDMLLAEGIPIEKIGKLVHVTNEQVAKPSFWRTDQDEASGFESFIQPGDLVALDEIWRFFPRGRGAIEPRAQNFFRMHGHMPHAVTGYICQIALISQSIRDFNGNVVDVVEQTFRMVKLSKLGMDKSYRIEIFEGGSCAKADFIRETLRTYDPKFFALYSSHSQKKDGAAEADEAKADDRGNVFKSGFFRLIIPLALVFAVVGFYGVWRFFHPAPVKPPQGAKAAPGSPGANQAPGAAHSGGPVPSEDWRVVGYVQGGGAVTFLLSGAQNQARFVNNPRAFKVAGGSSEVLLPNGDFAASWVRPGQSDRTVPGVGK